MKKTIKYKGYSGSVAFDAEDRIFHGRVLGVSSTLIGFEGTTIAELEKDFQNAVDDYLEMCAEQGKGGMAVVIRNREGVSSGLQPPRYVHFDRKPPEKIQDRSEKITKKPEVADEGALL